MSHSDFAHVSKKYSAAFESQVPQIPHQISQFTLSWGRDVTSRWQLHRWFGCCGNRRWQSRSGCPSSLRGLAPGQLWFADSRNCLGLKRRTNRQDCISTFHAALHRDMAGKDVNYIFWKSLTLPLSNRLLQPMIRLLSCWHTTNCSNLLSLCDLRSFTPLYSLTPSLNSSPFFPCWNRQEDTLYAVQTLWASHLFTIFLHFNDPTNLKPSICLIQNHWKKSIEKSDFSHDLKKIRVFFSSVFIPRRCVPPLWSESWFTAPSTMLWEL